MRKKTYTINVPPSSIVISRYGTAPRMWDTYTEAKTVYTISLEGQHEDEPIFTGPLHVDLVFYMPLPGHKPESRNRNYHFYQPDLDSLVKFIFDIGRGILYEKECLITSVNAKKKYSDKPRTKLTITALGEKNDKKS